MPPHKPVPRLQALAHDRVLYTVCGVILEDLFFSGQGEWESLGHPVLTERLQTVRDVLSNALLPRLLENLLNTILERDEAVEATVRFTALQLLLVPGVTKLTVGHFPEPMYCPVLSAIAESAAELRFLDLRGVWVREMHKFHLCRALRRLHMVKHLTLRYTCDDEVLAIVGKHCTVLEKLDISGSENISENGMRSLYEKRIQDKLIGLNDLSKTLKIVDIGGPGAQKLPVSQASLLLRFLPNLASLGGFEKTGAAVESVHQTDPTLKFNLVYIHDQSTNVQRLDVFSKTCPKLKGMYLDCPKGTAVQTIDMLKDIKDIKLHKTRWTDVEIMLRNMHRRLRTLNLSKVYGSLDVAVLARHCTHLTKLDLNFVSFINTAPDSEINERLFPELQELFIYRTTLPSAIVRTFLTCSEYLEHVAFGECNVIKDEEMINCIEMSSLKHLRELWFGQALHLTIESLRCIMENCPLVTSIGNLAAWNLGPGETAFINEQLVLTNTNLTLHDYGPDNDEEEGGVVIVFGVAGGEEGDEE